LDSFRTFVAAALFLAVRTANKRLNLKLDSFRTFRHPHPAHLPGSQPHPTTPHTPITGRPIAILPPKGLEKQPLYIPVAPIHAPNALNDSTMNQFPAVDQIPLPAPVWLLKALHDLTFSLHLASVGLLIGGLMLALAFAVLGSVRHAPVMTQAAGMLIHRLPTVMAFVINLGIPPLLFAQVLYGRALYTSSILIGTYWIAVILLLMGSYYGLYVSAGLAARQRTWFAPGFATLLLILTIALIYSNNMTLMLRPQSWSALYLHSPAGFQLNSSDPTLVPRWLFFMVGSFPAAGAALMLLALRSGLSDELARFLTRTGGVVLAVSILLQAVFAQSTLAAQPQNVVTTVMNDSLYRMFGFGWLTTAVLLALLGAAAAVGKQANALIGIAASVVAFLNVFSATMVRDGIRDVTLRAAGFDVWDRHVTANWSVIDLFLVLLVAAIVVVAWLAGVAGKAKRTEENYA